MNVTVLYCYRSSHSDEEEEEDVIESKCHCQLFFLIYIEQSRYMRIVTVLSPMSMAFRPLLSGHLLMKTGWSKVKGA